MAWKIAYMTLMRCLYLKFVMLRSLQAFMLRFLQDRFVCLRNVAVTMTKSCLGIPWTISSHNTDALQGEYLEMETFILT